jgi:hypothetical protein
MSAFGSLAASTEKHREQAEKLQRRLDGYIDGYRINKGVKKSAFATQALITYGMLLQAELDSEVPNMSLSLNYGRDIAMISAYLTQDL